jgi:hypothetical protein
MTRPAFLRLLSVFGAPLLVASAALSQSAPPASVAPSSDAERKAAASLDVFASQWMRKMERVEDDNRRKPQVVRNARSTEVTYRGYTNDFKVELRPTGVPGAPFVGLIRYGEQLFSCSDPGATRCGVSHTTPVTEIFRFQNGRWIY